MVGTLALPDRQDPSGPSVRTVGAPRFAWRWQLVTQQAFYPLNAMSLTDGQLREIGRVVVAFNRLELFLGYLLANLVTEEEEIGTPLASGETFVTLHDKLTRLIPLRVKDEALRSRMT